MRLTGYTDRWSVRPGETIAFHVHSDAPHYRAQLVRLIHGDENPLGPGFKEIEVASTLDGSHPGGPHEIRKGSYGIVEPAPAPGGDFVLELWIWPTLPGPGRQGITAWLAPNGRARLGVFLDAQGRLVVTGEGLPELVLEHPLALRQWYRLRLAVDRSSSSQTLEVEPQRVAPGATLRQRGERAGSVPRLDGSFVFAAGGLQATPDGAKPLEVFNGKIARPRLLGPDGALIAGWDFAADAGTVRLAGLAGTADGYTVNRPARAMTGPGWPGDNRLGLAEPSTHDAIHFHDDDVADVGWPESLRFEVPDDLPSGVYALRLDTDEDEDHLPFFVLPKRGREAPLAVLMPTMSYLAYANESLDVSGSEETAPRLDMEITPDRYAYVIANGLRSLYDLHRDGSGIAYGSRRRPIIDFRPKARCRTFGAPHQFAADLHLIDWLTQKGYAFDILTDDRLHEEGADLLKPHSVVITGSHPEYWTAKMLDARDSWLDDGGRLLYLGGNGFYWVTGVAEDQPDVIEVRRYTGTRTWMGLPGEDVVSVTGERGGLWRERGRSPNSRVGVGFSGQGFDRGMPYRRTEVGLAPDWSWIFTGVDEPVIGAGRSLVLGHGAAGFEVDKADPLWGTPPNTVVLASTQRFTDAYQAAMECFPQVHPWMGGSQARSGIQSDITITFGRNGGAVFSAGSIIWSSTLSAKDYDSDTSRITKNVIDAFIGGPIPGAPTD